MRLSHWTQAILIVVVLLLLMGAVTLVAEALVPTPAGASEHKVTICHATGSESNPFVEVEVAKKSLGNGHSPHAVHDGDWLGPCSEVDDHSSHHDPINPVATSTVQPPTSTPPVMPQAFPDSGGEPRETMIGDAWCSPEGEC